MFGPIDIDSLDFQTRVQIMQMSELTGVSREQVVRRAVEELYRRVTASAPDGASADRVSRAERSSEHREYADSALFPSGLDDGNVVDR